TLGGTLTISGPMTAQYYISTSGEYWSPGGTDLGISPGTSKRWVFEAATGYFRPAADNNYDIGVGGGTPFRPRNLYLAGLLDAPLLTPSGNTIEQRNGTTAQTLRIYNTYTSATVYERASFTWSGNTFYILTEMLGGTARQLTIGTANNTLLNFRTNNS